LASGETATTIRVGGDTNSGCCMALVGKSSGERLAPLPGRAHSVRLPGRGQ
jgi:hypothetical protein